MDSVLEIDLTDGLSFKSRPISERLNFRNMPNKWTQF